MSRNAWHIDSGPDHYTLARHWPPRFDVQAEAVLPKCDPARLARQIRQDLWRELKHLRGFSPVVQIRITKEHLSVNAGGRVIKPVPIECQNRIKDLLEHPRKRARWVSWAGKALA